MKMTWRGVLLCLRLVVGAAPAPSVGALRSRRHCGDGPATLPTGFVDVVQCGALHRLFLFGFAP